LGAWWAGPLCCAILADMGARVIKVESRIRFDGMRFAPYAPDIEVGMDMFLMVNRNKLGCTLNLAKPKGREAFLRLVEKSDVVVENFSPEVLTKLNLRYDVLQGRNPGLVMISLSGMGTSGPGRDLVSWGPTLEALSGINYMMGYPDSPPLGIGVGYCDPTGGTFGALAVMTALHYRDDTGEGQYIDLSQLEATTSLLPEELLQYTFNGRVPARSGNRENSKAPCGVYPSRGEDKWIAIAVSTQGEWEAMCRATANTDWLRDERFSTEASRLEHREQLDAEVSQWTREQSAAEAVELLQQAGVPAGVSYSVDELLNDPQLKERNVVVEVPHPKKGKYATYAPFAKFSETPLGVFKHAPMLGEDNEYVFSELLGLSREEIDELATEDQPPAAQK